MGIISLWYHAGLVDQLNLLRNINTRLVDENDLRSYTSGPSNSLNETNSLAHEMDQMLVDRDQVEEDDDDQDMADPTALEHLALQFNFMQKNEVKKTGCLFFFYIQNFFFIILQKKYCFIDDFY